MGAGRWGSGGGGGGIHGAVTVSLDGGGGAALMTVTGIVCDREAGGAGGDGGLAVGTITREIGGDGGLVTGGLRTRFAGLAVDCATAASFKQSCDWCKEDGTRTGGDRGSRMLCALATLALLVRFSFLGGGDGFCRVADGAGLGTMGDFANPLGVISGLPVTESVVLCPCSREINNFT